jgi:hypothetical protein
MPETIEAEIDTVVFCPKCRQVMLSNAYGDHTVKCITEDCELFNVEFLFPKVTLERA